MENSTTKQLGILRHAIAKSAELALDAGEPTTERRCREFTACLAGLLDDPDLVDQLREVLAAENSLDGAEMANEVARLRREMRVLYAELDKVEREADELRRERASREA